MFYNEIHTRIRFILLLVLLLFLIVIFKVFYIQFFSYKKLNNLTEELWSRELVINAPRGDIVDRNGVVLASNITTTSIYVVPSQIKDKVNTSKEISKILGCTYQDVYKYVSKKSSMEIIKKGKDIDSIKADKIDKLKLDGVYLVVDTKRYYPYKEALAHIIGFVGSDNQGLSGIKLF